MKKLLFYLLVVSLLVGGVAKGQESSSSFVLPSPGITPASPFHFIEKWIEGIQEFFTFSPEGKARLQLVFAAKRIAEIKDLLINKGVEAKGLDVAENELQDHLSSASTILDKEKEAGRDVSGIARELSDKLKGEREALKNVFRSKQDDLESQIDALKNELEDAQKNGDAAAIGSIQNQIEQLKSDRDLLGEKEQNDDDAADQEVDNIHAHLGANNEATEKIKDIEEKKAEFLSEAQKENLTIPAGAFNEFDSLITQAKSALDKGDYGQAIAFADQAKEALRSIQHDFEQAKSDKETEEEIKSGDTENSGNVQSEDRHDSSGELRTKEGMATSSEKSEEGGDN